MTTLVTGGCRGIGRANALAVAEPGATASAIRARGAQPVVLAVDITDEQAVQRAFDELRASSPRLDLLVNNAGVGGGQPIDKTDTVRWRQIVDTNVWGTFLVSRQAVSMLGDGGRIVNL